MTMIRLHTAGTPNGEKAKIALEELGLDYEQRIVRLAEGEQMSEDFLALNPNHKIPVLEDDGLVVWESGAILLHLAEKYGGLLPQDPAGRIHAIQYAFFQTGGIGPALGRLGTELRKPEAERSADMIRYFSQEVGRLCAVLERVLSDGRDYLAGEYSIGDVMHYPWMARLLERESPLLMDRQCTVAWIRRIGERPAVQRGMQIP
jgi:GST-like protein